MKNGLIIFGLILMGCEVQVNDDSDNYPSELIDLFTQDLTGPVCLKNHTDSIIPIIYGYPSAELWAKSDSGLVAIGGCELMEEQDYCKIHQISF